MEQIYPFHGRMSHVQSTAPGWPGIAPRWTSSAKEGVGTSASYQSRVWFTISHGILNEVYYPRIDQANTRDMEFLVADGDQYFSEEKHDTNRRIAPLEQGVPGYRLVNSCKRGRYRITKTVVTDPERDVLLQKVHFDVGKGKLEDYGIYALLAPHIGNRGYGNNGWIGACFWTNARRGGTAGPERIAERLRPGAASFRRWLERGSVPEHGPR